jgi:hypothetical protein
MRQGMVLRALCYGAATSSGSSVTIMRAAPLLLVFAAVTSFVSLTGSRDARA